MSSPPILNDLMEFLNDTFGWHIPTLPLNGFLGVVKDLWNAAIGFLPTQKTPLPWRVPVDMEIPLPGIHTKIENIVVVVDFDHGSPNGSPTRSPN